MRSKVLLIICILAATINSYGQSITFKDGIYLNIEQLRAGTPVANLDLKIEKRGENSTIMSGNNYKLLSDIDTVHKYFLKTKVYAYVKNGSIFLNCLPHNLQEWYALSLTKGNYLLFKGAMSNKLATTVAILAGPIAASLAAEKRYFYVLSLRTGNVLKCSKEYIENRLKENRSDLLDQFRAEYAKSRLFETVAVKYLNIVNEVVSPLSKVN